jgi:hypothetical protein
VFTYDASPLSLAKKPGKNRKPEKLETGKTINWKNRKLKKPGKKSNGKTGKNDNTGIK